MYLIALAVKDSLERHRRAADTGIIAIQPGQTVPDDALSYRTLGPWMHDITVAVLPEADEVEVELDENELRIDTFCSSGPGGQSVNTTQSAVRITHLPTNTVVQCQDEKSWHKNKARALQVLRSRLYDRMLREQHEKIARERRGMVGSGDRSEKIRTYNFPQSRITDHRIGFTVHNLPTVLGGALDPLVEALAAHDQAERLKSEQLA